MDSSKLRRLISELATQGGFSKTKSAWFRVTPETIVGLDLQRSGYSRLYFLNLKVWVQSLWDDRYSASDLIGETGHIFRREPREFSDALDLENEFPPGIREARIEELFRTFVVPLSRQLGSREG